MVGSIDPSKVSPEHFPQEAQIKNGVLHFRGKQYTTVDSIPIKNLSAVKCREIEKFINGKLYAKELLGKGIQPNFKISQPDLKNEKKEIKKQFDKTIRPTETKDKVQTDKKVGKLIEDWELEALLGPDFISQAEIENFLLPTAEPPKITEEHALTKNMIDHLNHKLANPKLGREKRAQIENALKFYHQALTGKAGAALPTNMSYQQLNIPNEKLSFHRLGVLSDKQNGWISLRDLKMMKEDASKIEAKIKVVESMIARPLTGKKLESAKNTLSQLQALLKNSSVIDNMIMNRKRLLGQQMIQLVEAQVKQHPEKLKEAFSTGVFTLVHVGLLDQKKSTLENSGEMDNERVKMEDMLEIFDEFKDKKLILDGKGPYIDENNIHLSIPFSYHDKKSDKTYNAIALNTVFFNLSVEGHKENSDPQKSNNIGQLSDLLTTHPYLLQQHPELLVVIQNKETSYEGAAEVLSVLLREQGLAVSLGCADGGLRTENLIKQLTEKLTPTVRGHRARAKGATEMKRPIKAVSEERTENVVPHKHKGFHKFIQRFKDRSSE